MLLDLVYPKSCFSCNEWGIYLCEKCRNKIEYVEKDACFYCNKISLFGITHERCRRPQGIDGILAAAYYTPVMQKCIHSIKYEFAYAGMRDIFYSLNPLVMAKYLGCARLYKSSVLQPIPLHFSRYRWRGFNQAQMLAKYFHQVTHLPLDDSVIRRTFRTPQAHTNGRLQRILNIQNAFALKSGKNDMIHDKIVILVDDVITTGSTVKEVCRMLKQAGASQVFAWCLARD